MPAAFSRFFQQIAGPTPPRPAWCGVIRGAPRIPPLELLRALVGFFKADPAWGRRARYDFPESFGASPPV